MVYYEILSLEMYIFYSLASILLLIDYALLPVGNEDYQWSVFIISNLIKKRKENEFINNLFVVFEISYITFAITLLIISPLLINQFMQQNQNIDKILKVALILSML